MLAAFLILAGALSDHYGRRRIYALGLAGFGITSALCGLSPSLEWLVLFRLLQGAAGALLVPGSLSLITQAFHGAERSRAFGIWAASTSALTVLGPIIGGTLVDTIGWRVAFLVNVPLLAIALWVTLRHVEESRDTEAEAGFDWLGAIVAALAVGGLSFGLIRGQAHAWADTAAWVAIGVGAVALVLFPILMAVRPHPLVPLSLFRSRAFTAINLATFFVYGALYVTLGYQSLVFQGVLGYTATAAAIVGLPVGIFLSVLSTRVGTLAGRMGARPFLVVGPLLMAAGLLWLARLPAHSAAWKAAVESPGTLIPPVDVLIDVEPYVFLFAIGISLVVAPLTSTLMSSIPGRFSGLGSAINNSISRVGQPLLGAIIFVAISATFYTALGSLEPSLDTTSTSVRSAFQPLNPPPSAATPGQADAAKQASIDAFRLAMVVSAGLLVVGSAVSWFGLGSGPSPAESRSSSSASESTASG